MKPKKPFGFTKHPHRPPVEPKTRKAAVVARGAELEGLVTRVSAGFSSIGTGGGLYRRRLRGAE